MTGEELDQAVAAFRSGRYDRVVTTGGPIERWLNFRGSSNYADWAARQGLALKGFDVFTAGAHARRSRMLYRMAFGPDVEVGVLSARPQEYDERHWWRTSAGARSVLGEAISMLWTTCCFYAAPPGSHEEIWGGLPP